MLGHGLQPSEARAAAFVTVRARLMRRSREEHSLPEGLPPPPPPPPAAVTVALNGSSHPPARQLPKHRGLEKSRRTQMTLIVHALQALDLVLARLYSLTTLVIYSTTGGGEILKESRP